MSAPEVIAIGEALVEIMRTGPAQPFHEPGPFEGPFALATTRRGPMEGASTRAEAEAVLRASQLESPRTLDGGGRGGEA